MIEPATTWLRDAEVPGLGIVDVRLRGARVDAVAPGVADGSGTVVECAGAALLPGLHDHHLHLLATAAAARSVGCGPPAVRTRSELRDAIRSAEPDAAGWIRGVGYDESVAGDLDASALTAIRADVPTRVQHRSGALWSLNSAGLRAIGADAADVAGLLGIERDAAGAATGRLWRLDRWLGERLGSGETVDLAPLSRRLASFGITGVTDATPDLDPSAPRALATGGLDQHLTLLGDPDGAAPSKIVVADHALPSWDELAERIGGVRPRPVALHVVTRAALVLVLGVLDAVGTVPGDRIEHAAVAAPELAGWIARLGPAVVTQPSFVRLRGDDYLERVEEADRPHLWPHRSLIDAGVRVGCSSDAPYGDLDPWASIAAAASRRSVGGRLVAPDEAVTAGEALDGYLGAAGDPGGEARRIGPGVPADLALLDRPLAAALAQPGSVTVRGTWIDGRRVWGGS